MSNTLDTDVLIIGGGLAGCFAAIAAKDFAPRVTLVDKAVVSRSGCSSWAYYHLAPVPAESFADWRQELVEHGNYLNNQDWVDVLLEEHSQRLADMERWGAPFERDEQGKLIQKKGRGHNKTNFVISDARARMESLKKKASELGVQIVEGVMVTDLLTSDGEHPTRGAVIGAVGFDTRSKDFRVFRSKATVITSGPMVRRSNQPGDGVAMAFRAGAELTCMEFCIGASCHLTDGEHDLGSFNVLMASLGGRVLNARGERFMEKYAPVLKERAAWQLITQALAKEHLEGRTPAVWDLSIAKPEDIDDFERLHPDRVAPYKKAGIDLKKDRILFFSDIGITSGSGNGGIRIDLDGKTNLPGLYAAGSVCKNFAHGTYAVGGLNLAFCSVSGHRTGLKAGRESSQAMLQEPDPKQAESLEAQIYSPLKGGEGPTPDQVFHRIEELVKPIRSSVIKTEDGIRETISAFERLERDDLPRITARDAHELAKANQAKSYALCAKLVFLAALGRKESRWFHYRADYPYTDNKDWLKWSIIKRQEGGEIGVTFEPVPIDRYPVKPPKREQIPCPVQL
jgi:succinate dehydrogenase/fumarate reductase flavoprotein subunit